MLISWAESKGSALLAVPLLYLAPPNQPEVPHYLPTDRYLVPDVRTYRIDELDLSNVTLDLDDLSSQRGGANVYHKHLIHLQLLHFGSISFCLDS